MADVKKCDVSGRVAPKFNITPHVVTISSRQGDETIALDSLELDLCDVGVVRLKESIAKRSHKSPKNWASGQ